MVPCVSQSSQLKSLVYKYKTKLRKLSRLLLLSIKSRFCKISAIHFAEKVARSHFSYTFRMSYNIKRVSTIFLKKKTLFCGFHTKRDNSGQKLGFQVLCVFFLIFCMMLQLYKSMYKGLKLI